MHKDFVLVTGAASGIGRATALRFAAEGYPVCVTDKQEERLRETYSALPAGDHLFFPADYALAEDAIRFEKFLVQNNVALTALVNCAGLSEKSDPINSTLVSWHRVFDIMVNGCLQMSSLAVRFMPSGGRIIHVSSIHSGRAEAGASSYSMAKAAIDQFCRSMAVELADKNILVNAIAPGFVDTAMSMVDGISELESEWFRNNYVKGHHLPLRRAARAEEIAGVAFFLSGNDASYITGQVIVVDGGLTITF